MNQEPPETIIFYDGVCNFCDSTVQFILRFDKKKKFHFCALQSEYGQQILKNHGFQQVEMDTIVMLYEGKVLTQSTAVLTTMKVLGGIFSLGYGFIIFPSFIRDWLYSLFARNRYRMFGKKDACRIPTATQRTQFIGF